MKFDRRTNMALFGFLLFLNYALRFLLIGNHEEGADSFVIHSLSNTISNLGYAKWIIHPMSYFGFTPLSYPCAVPYFLSGISQLTGLDIESSVLLMSMITATIGLGSSYLMAMEIKPDHRFAFIIAFIYSLSPIFVEYTVWQATSRSLFMAFIPLLIWSLMRTIGERPTKIVNVFICLLIFTIMGTIHHMFLLLPLFIIAYFSSLFIYNRLIKRKTKDLWVFRYQTIIITVLFLVLFLPQFSHQGIYSTVSWQQYESGLFFNGTRKYVIFMNFMIDYWSRTNFFAFLSVFGFFTLLYRPRKKIANALKRYKYNFTSNEIFVIMCILITIPFVTLGTYVSLIFLPFFSVFIGYFILKLMKIFNKNKKVLATFFVSFLMISLGFTVFMNVHWNHAITNQPISEHTYSTSIFIKDNLDNTTLANNGLIAGRISAISEKPCLPLGGAHAAWYPPELLVYDYADVEDYTFSRISFDIVILTQSDYLFTTEFGVNAKEDWVSIMRSDVDHKRNLQLYNRYNIEQVVEYLPNEKRYYFWSLRDSVFYMSLPESKYKLFVNSEERVWLL